MEKQMGKVKWFNDAKGYGFIAPDSGQPDVFVHFRNIMSSGYKKLTEGQSVRFRTIQGQKGLQADEVEPL